MSNEEEDKRRTRIWELFSRDVGYSYDADGKMVFNMHTDAEIDEMVAHLKKIFAERAERFAWFFGKVKDIEEEERNKILKANGIDPRQLSPLDAIAAEAEIKRRGQE
jgi:hypothetical protein